MSQNLGVKTMNKKSCNVKKPVVGKGDPDQKTYWDPRRVEDYFVFLRDLKEAGVLSSQEYSAGKKRLYELWDDFIDVIP